MFSYGTLKRGEPNHHWLSKGENGNQRFCGVANTKEKFPLVIASRYNIPYILAAPGQGNVSCMVYFIKLLINYESQNSKNYVSLE